MELFSVREHPQMADRFIEYFQKRWASEDSKPVYEDCIKNCLETKSPLPQWYLLMEGNTVIGCAGLITNDFISRMDLWPWLCALYVEEAYRCKGNAGLLIAQCIKDAKAAGFEKLYLCTDHESFYERYGFEYMATGYHPWGESSRIYVKNI